MRIHTSLIARALVLGVIPGFSIGSTLPTVVTLLTLLLREIDEIDDNPLVFRFMEVSLASFYCVHE